MKQYQDKPQQLTQPQPIHDEQAEQVTGGKCPLPLIPVKTESGGVCPKCGKQFNREYVHRSRFCDVDNTKLEIHWVTDLIKPD